MVALFALILTLAPAPVQAPAHPQPYERCPQWEDLIRKAGLPVRMFSYIAYRESRCQARVIGNPKSRRPDYGLMQINGSWVTVTSKVCRARYGDLKVLLSPTCNVAVAKYLWDRGGRNHWRNSSAGWHG